MIGAFLSVPTGAVGLVASGVQKLRIDEHRHPFESEHVLTRLNATPHVVNSHARLHRAHGSRSPP
jgi:hypothetical protein